MCKRAEERSVRRVHSHTWIFLALSHLTPRNQAERFNEGCLQAEDRHGLIHTLLTPGAR
jgi:hypothetical protein